MTQLAGAAAIFTACLWCAFLAGLYVGRFAERRRICEWLWEQTAMHWGKLRDIEDGVHRKHFLDPEPMLWGNHPEADE